MSADNFNFVRRVGNRWNVWLSLSASCDVMPQIARAPNNSFDTRDEAVRWADEQGYTEYGTEVDLGCHTDCRQMPGGTGPCACLDGCGACDSCGRWLGLGLTSCDFVGDSGCSEPTCPRCHGPARPSKLSRIAAVLEGPHDDASAMIEAIRKIVEEPSESSEESSESSESWPGDLDSPHGGDE